MAARRTKLALDHAALAQRYAYWALQQINLAERSSNPKVREDRVALAEYYFTLAEAEMRAVKRPATSAIGDIRRGGLPRAA